MQTLELEKEEAHILIAAAIRGMRGTTPLGADPMTEKALINKLVKLGEDL